MSPACKGWQSSLGDAPVAAAQTTESAFGPNGEVRITAAAFLRSMWSLFLACFTHPLRTTVVDLTTGRVVEHR